MKMSGKVALTVLAVLIAGSVLAGPAVVQVQQNSTTDEYLEVQFYKQEIPPPTHFTDEEWNYVSTKQPIPETPTPVYDWFWVMLKATRWAD